jgi:hypothetical protein
MRNRSIVAARNDPFTVGAQANRIDLVGVSPEGLQEIAALAILQDDREIVGCRELKVPVAADDRRAAPQAIVPEGANLAVLRQVPKLHVAFILSGQFPSTVGADGAGR